MPRLGGERCWNEAATKETRNCLQLRGSDSTVTPQLICQSCAWIRRQENLIKIQCAYQLHLLLIRVFKESMFLFLGDLEVSFRTTRCMIKSQDDSSPILSWVGFHPASFVPGLPFGVSVVSLKARASNPYLIINHASVGVRWKSSQVSRS